MGCRRRTLAAALVAAAAGPVLAVPVTFGSTASITNLSYRLVDLAPDDGIEPGVTFIPSPATSFVETVLAGRQGIVRNRKVIDFGFTGTTSSTLSKATASATGIVRVDGAVPAPIVSGSAMRNGGNFEAYSASTIYTFKIELAPHTLMEWSGEYTVTSWATPNSRARNTDRAQAEVWFGHAGMQDGVVAYADPKLGSGFSQRHRADVYTFGNYSDESIQQTGGFGVFVSGGNLGKYMGPLAPIPEPSTYALMFAGLGVVGVVARKRASRTS